MAKTSSLSLCRSNWLDKGRSDGPRAKPAADAAHDPLLCNNKCDPTTLDGLAKVKTRPQNSCGNSDRTLASTSASRKMMMPKYSLTARQDAAKDTTCTRGIGAYARGRNMGMANPARTSSVNQATRSAPVIAASSGVPPAPLRDVRARLTLRTTHQGLRSRIRRAASAS